MLRLLLFVLPLGLDTLGVSISLGIKSQPHDKSGHHDKSAFGNALPPWLGSALLFSLAETVMPLVGLTIGYAVSLFLSSIMHILGPLLLIGVGLWELLQEVHERISRQGGGTDGGGRRQADAPTASLPPLLTTAGAEKETAPRWGRQLLLALSVSLDELAIGFSLGAITAGLPGSKTINTITLCILIGLQGFLMTLIGLTLGRTLRVRLKFVKEWTEFLSCFLLIALGAWLLLRG